MCKKVLYSMAKLFFNQKLFHFFCQNAPSSIHSIYGILYTLYGSECRFFTLYGSECREEKKKAKHGEMRWTQIATSDSEVFRIFFDKQKNKIGTGFRSNLNIEKEFHYTVKDFFA